MRTFYFAAAAIVSGTLLFAKAPAPAPDVQVQMTVTVEARHGSEPPILHANDVLAFQRDERLAVTDFMPCRDEHAGLDLFILIDDASSTELGVQLNDLRRFIDAQPATTSVGVAYMQNATVKIAQNLTAHHSQAAGALRLPLGYPGVSPSPFLSLSDLIKRWPAGALRREVVLIGSGIDPLGGAIVNPYLDAAIRDAQRAGVIVYTIYTPAAGHLRHDFWRINWGQNHLSQMADETGGESYMIGFGPAVSFAPYLQQIADHLANQYLVRFLVKPGEKAGFQRVRFTTEVPNADPVAARQVYAPAGAK